MRRTRTSTVAGLRVGSRHARRSRRYVSLQLEELEDRSLLASFSLPGDTPPSILLDQSEHRPSSLIVQFRDGASAPGSLAAHLLTANLQPEWALTPGLRKVDVDPNADLADVIRAFKQDPNVAFAEPDYRVSLQVLPNDADFGSLYGLNNTGQNGIADSDIDAPEAWEITTGDHDTIVAVIDTGVDYTHPDLAANIWTNTNEIPNNGKDDDRNGYVDDIHGYDFVNRDGDPMDDNFHGTHIAGTIGAVGNNGIGVAGVNWHVQIMALKFLDSGGGGYESDAIGALNYAVANGAVVSNNSWGGGGFSQAFQAAIENAASRGHIFVAAAGNDHSNNDSLPFYPANYDVPNVISVAATDDNDKLAYFSNYGVNSVDLAAPGVDIYSTFPTHVTAAMQAEGFSPNYGIISGTSMATPHVTGVVALVRSLHPDWTNDQVISQILDTVDGITGLPTITSGRVNAAGAVGNPSPDSTGPRIVGSDPAVFTINTLSHIRLQFSEAIDLSTVSVDDVVNLQGPSGAIPILSITPVAGTSRQIDVNFAPQTAVGQYQLVVGPNIADRAGNLMNQDGDELFGELPEDEYTTQFSILSGLHFDSFEVPAPISGFTIVGSSLVVDRDIVIGDLNVTVNIFYPDVRDLMLLLVSPAGNATYLSFLDGAAGLGFVNTTFDDEAAGSITTGTSPFTGSFRPNNPVSGSARPLSRFDGESMLGTWTLWVQNFQFTSSFGILTAWSLDVTPATGPPPDDGTNQPPVAQNDSIEATAGGPVTFDARVLLDNDSDPDGDILAIVGVHDGSGGTVQLNGNGTITFTPAEDFVGTGDFEYIISDGLATAVGHVTVNVGAQFLWHNRNLNVDVDGDEEVTANDVLMIINIINAVGSTSLVGLSSLSHSNLYLDVTADDFVAADDVMEVINYINAHPDQAPPDQAEPGQPPDSEIDTALLSLLTEGSTKRK